MSIHRLLALFLGGAAFIAALGGMAVVNPGFPAPLAIAVPVVASTTAALFSIFLSHRLMTPDRAGWLRAVLCGGLCAFLSMLVSSILVIFAVQLAWPSNPGNFQAILFGGIVMTQIACGIFAYPLAAIAALVAWAIGRKPEPAILAEAKHAF